MFPPHPPPVAAPPEAAQTEQVTQLSANSEWHFRLCTFLSPGPLPGLERQRKVENRPARGWGKLSSGPDPATNRAALCSAVACEIQAQGKADSRLLSSFLSLCSVEKQGELG